MQQLDFIVFTVKEQKLFFSSTEQCKNSALFRMLNYKTWLNFKWWSNTLISLPDLANEITGCLAQFEFKVSKK